MSRYEAITTGFLFLALGSALGFDANPAYANIFALIGICAAVGSLSAYFVRHTKNVRT